MQEEVKTNAQNDALRQKLKDLTENYRAKLLEYINQDDETADEQQAMLQELLTTYRAKELELTELTDRLREKNHDTMRRIRNTQRMYKVLRYQVEDLGASSGIKLPDEEEDDAGEMLTSTVLLHNVLACWNCIGVDC